MQAAGEDDIGPLTRRIRARCLQRGWDVSELARRARISRTTAHQLLAGTTQHPRASTLARIAGALEISTAELNQTDAGESLPVVDVGGTSSAAAFDRETNPSISEVSAASPRLFAGWTPAEWDELYSTFGTGGALTADGVRQAAASINRKRETVRKVHVLLETHLGDVAAQLVETLYRMVRPAANLEPAPSLAELLDFHRGRRDNVG